MAVEAMELKSAVFCQISPVIWAETDSDGKEYGGLRLRHSLVFASAWLSFARRGSGVSAVLRRWR